LLKQSAKPSRQGFERKKVDVGVSLKKFKGDNGAEKMKSSNQSQPMVIDTSSVRK
jgi:hypothetical protein